MASALLSCSGILSGWFKGEYQAFGVPWQRASARKRTDHWEDAAAE